MCLGLMAILIHCRERARAVFWRWFLLLTCLALAVAARAANSPAESLELQVKAAFLYNFAKSMATVSGYLRPYQSICFQRGLLRPLQLVSNCDGVL